MIRWAAVALLAGALAGCGADIQSPDLFLLTRIGQGRKLTLLVNDGGTIRCDGGRNRRLSDPLLLQARDLASGLGGDAQEKLRIPSPPNSVYRYTIRLQQGTISFPDTAAASGKYPRLAQAELFATRAAQQACRTGG
jgi:hypothetical protein